MADGDGEADGLTAATATTVAGVAVVDTVTVVADTGERNLPFENFIFVAH